MDFPEREEELLILRENLPHLEQSILEYVADFLQKAHRADERYSVRDGINIARYAAKLVKSRQTPIAGELRRSIKMVLGDEALLYAE